MMGRFIQGLLLGLSIAAPVGPVGILCIRRTLTMGPLAGLVSGLGAATADGLYGCIAGFGLSAIADFLVAQANWLRLGGGCFLCYLGLTTLWVPPKPMAAAPPDALSTNRSLLGAYTSTLALTLTNPATIFSFLAIFAGLGIAESGHPPVTAGVMVGGVFLGSALWWLILSGTVNLFRSRLTSSRMRWLNRVSGILILAFGVMALGMISQ